MEEQHDEGYAGECVHPDVFRRRGQGELQDGEHQRGPDDAGRESRRGGIEPDEQDDRDIAQDVSVPEERQPPEQQVGEQKDDAHVQSRNGEQVRGPAARVGRTECRGERASIPGRHSVAEGLFVGRQGQTVEPCDGPFVQEQGEMLRGKLPVQGVAQQQA